MPFKKLTYLVKFFKIPKSKTIALFWSVLFIFFLLTPQLSPFISATNFLYDQIHSLYPRQAKSQPVVIVEIDESTLAALGQWPWPRNYLAALIDQISTYQPSVIGLDIVMPEPDHSSPEAILESRPDLNREIAANLLALQTNDTILMNSIFKAPVVLGAAGFFVNTTTTQNGLLTKPIQSKPDNATKMVDHYPFVLSSLPIFQKVALGQGVLSNNIEDGIIRKLSMVTAINNTLTPSFSLELLRVYLHANNLIVSTGKNGINGISINSSFYHLQNNGTSLIYFDRQSRTRYISALDVLKGNVDKNSIKNKIVLVGLTGIGLQDMVSTPLGDRRPGVEVHAQIIENFIDDLRLSKPLWMQWLEIVIMLLLSALIIIFLPKSDFNNALFKKIQTNRLNPFSSQIPIFKRNEVNINSFNEKRKIPRTTTIKPLTVMLVVLTLSVSLLIIGIVLFNYGFLFDSMTLIIGTSTITLTLFFGSSFEFERQKKLMNSAFQNHRIKSAQIAGELNAARRIQLGTLPNPDTALNNELRVKVNALLEPAKEVGGDLYDYFMVDESRLFFIIGDVAGKGLPASLFMVVSKALAKSTALNNKGNIGEIITKANNEIVRENPESLFVTCVAGLLNIDTGVLELLNAGHEDPWLLNHKNCLSKLKADGGPPLGILEEIDYQYKRVTLSKGDTLIMMTDGIYEATNKLNELYGTERIQNVLETISHKNVSTDQIMKSIREDIRTFVDDNEPSDDLTLLLIKWDKETSH